VHGGLADLSVFDRFLEGLKQGLALRRFADVWPCFVVGKVGTDLHTTLFDPTVARQLAAHAARYGSVIKGHYTDYVSNAEEYPRSGMGGANVGPEFTEAEHGALEALAKREEALGLTPSGMMTALRDAVVASGRWEKWRQPDEADLPFGRLSPERQGWLVRTGCRYIWAAPEVVAARRRLYANLQRAGEPGEEAVLGAIRDAIVRYYRAFGLVNSLPAIEEALAKA
jgi:D-tagatose-1,6-bisphosphate aldolase subunit GatZ/KbaZ